MKISIPLIDIKDQLLILLSEGFDVLGYSFMWSHDVNAITMKEEQWRNKVYKYLYDTFPTAKEAGQFLHTPGPMLGFVTDERVSAVRNMLNIRLKVLEAILDTLEKYYQFDPETLRLYIQQIDSFSKVRGINFDQIKGYVEKGVKPPYPVVEHKTPLRRRTRGLSDVSLGLLGSSNGLVAGRPLRLGMGKGGGATL